MWEVDVEKERQTIRLAEYYEGSKPSCLWYRNIRKYGMLAEYLTKRKPRLMRGISFH